MTLSPASSVEGGAGLLALLFSSVLSQAAAAIDTGADGIAGGYNVLEVWLLVRTTENANPTAVNVRVNGDTGANYDRQILQAANASVTAAAAVAQTQWGLVAPGATAEAGAAGAIRLTIPGYASTTFHKTAECTFGTPDDTAADNRADVLSLRWKSAAAISRLSVEPAAGATLAAGSTLLIYGR